MDDGIDGIEWDALPHCIPMTLTPPSRDSDRPQLHYCRQTATDGDREHRRHTATEGSVPVIRQQTAANLTGRSATADRSVRASRRDVASDGRGSVPSTRRAAFYEPVIMSTDGQRADGPSQPRRPFRYNYNRRRETSRTGGRGGRGRATRHRRRGAP